MATAATTTAGGGPTGATHPPTPPSPPPPSALVVGAAAPRVSPAHRGRRPRAPRLFCCRCRCRRNRGRREGVAPSAATRAATAGRVSAAARRASLPPPRPTRPRGRRRRAVRRMAPRPKSATTLDAAPRASATLPFVWPRQAAAAAAGRLPPVVGGQSLGDRAPPLPLPRSPLPPPPRPKELPPPPRPPRSLPPQPPRPLPPGRRCCRPRRALSSLPGNSGANVPAVTTHSRAEIGRPAPANGRSARRRRPMDVQRGDDGQSTPSAATAARASAPSGLFADRVRRCCSPGCDTPIGWRHAAGPRGAARLARRRRVR